MSNYQPSVQDLKSSLVFVEELSTLLGRKPQTIRMWLCRDKLPEGLPRPKKLFNANCWSRADVELFIANMFSK